MVSRGESCGLGSIGRPILARPGWYSSGDVCGCKASVAPQRPVDEGPKSMKKTLLDGRSFEDAEGKCDRLEGGQAIAHMRSAQTVVRRLGRRKADGLERGQT